MNETGSNPYVIPLSILISGVLIAAAIMYVGDGSFGRVGAQLGSAADGGTEPSAKENNSLELVRPISAEDHLLGNPSAPVKIIEYSDLECPFCSQFHLTMKQAMDEFGKEGKVAWVYRHFPLEQIHQQARPGAEAAECADDLGGSQAFWSFIDTVFAKQEAGLSAALFSQTAGDVGLDRAAFDSCVSANSHGNIIDADIQNALDSGGQGTPYSVIVAADGSKQSIPGAVPYATLKSQIERALGGK